MTDSQVGGLALLVILSLAMYFLPTTIASMRYHKNFGPILVINLFFGWTILGWVGALAWACSYQESRHA